MALINLLFNPRSFKNQLGYTNSKGEITSGISIDATLSESHSYKSNVTKNEIEKDVNGFSVVNDNIIHDPITVQLTGIISEAPINFDNLGKNIALGALANVSKVASVAGGVLSSELLSKNNPRRVDNNFNFLVQLRDDRKPISIITGLKRYKDMVITSIVFTKDNKIGRSLKFTISLSQILIVSSDTSFIQSSKISDTAKPSGASKIKLGKQGTKTPTVDESTKGSSIAFKIFG